MRWIPRLSVAATFSITLACGGGGSDTPPEPTPTPDLENPGIDCGGTIVFDTDEDTISDGDEGAESERDSDGDGWPDYQDLDSDSDTISDKAEAGDDDVCTLPSDHDGDETVDALDEDSDQDTLSDEIEAAASSGGIIDDPVDTDADTVPDYLDSDSDGDYLPDIDEAGITSPILTDTDGDEADDLIETSLDTDPNDPADSPEARGWIAFLAPYQDGLVPAFATLTGRTAVTYLDIYLNFDITGSMSGELSALGDLTTGLPSVITNLRCTDHLTGCTESFECATGEVCGPDFTCIDDPVTNDCVPDVWSGVGTWEGLDTFRNRVSLQSNPTSTAIAIPGVGAGTAEAVFQGAECVADGVGCTSSVKACASSGVGCAGFRESATKVLMQVSDADDQCTGVACASYTATSAGQALAGAGIVFTGLCGTADDSGSVSGTPCDAAEAIAVAAGSIDSLGDPFVTLALDAGVVAATQSMLTTIITEKLWASVTLELTDGLTSPGATALIDHVLVNDTGAGCTTGLTTSDADLDTFDDTFAGAQVRAPLCWDLVTTATQSIFASTTQAQVFDIIATITAGAEGTLSARRVFFVVPPAP